MLAMQDADVSVVALWRFSKRQKFARNKRRPAAEQDRHDILIRRQAWFDGPLIVSARLIP